MSDIKLPNSGKILSDLRELRAVLGKGCALVESLRAFRAVDGLADIAPDMPIGGAVDVSPEVLAKLVTHFEKQDSWRELDNHVEGLLEDALALLDGVIRSIDGGAES